MLGSFFPVIYALVVIFLLWQAFKVMSKGFFTNQRDLFFNDKKIDLEGDRTGKVTVHPELIDQKGRITDEELLTVRFSADNDPPDSLEKSNE